MTELMDYDEAARRFDPVLGIEVHVELGTKTKMFDAAPNAFGGDPNTFVTPVSLGLPGSLPVVNHKAVEYAIKIGLALNCEIAEYCRFARKNYFYPDLTKAFQTSQSDEPIAHDGYVDVELEDGTMFRVQIERAHMEEDAGKLIHDEWEDCSLVDYNRSGVPLIEIVSEPDMRSAEEVIAYLEKLRLIIQYLGASDCKLQEGSMRADVNLSVREAGAPEFGTRTEMKNLNSFKAIARAIEGERRRQIELLEEGRQVIQETRRWDDNKESSKAMRSKEDAQDYRYFPDPDLVPVVISDEWIARVKARQPELRTEKIARYKEEYGLPEYDARLLTSSKHMADIFEETTRLSGRPKEASNWLMVEAMRLMKEQEMEPEDMEFSTSHLAALIRMVENNIINRTVAKTVFEEIFRHDADPEAYVEENGLKVVKDEGALRDTVKAVMAANPQSVEDYRNGREKAMGFLVGQTMKAMKGKADPSMVNQLVRELLAGGDV